MRFKLFYCPIVVCLFGVLVAGCLDFSAVDADGRACEQITGSDIDAVSPIVKEIRLADPSRGARNFWLEIVFSEPMDFELSNWAQDHFALFEEGEYSSGLVADFAHPPLKANLRGKKVQGEWLPGERGTTFKFVPIKLDDFTTYYLLLSKNLRDLAGNPLAGNLISSYVENDNRKNLSNPFCQKADFVYKLKLQDVSSPMVWLSNQETVEVASNLQTGIPFYFSEPVFGDLQKEVKLFCNGQELPFYIKENRSEQGSDTGLLSAEIFPGQQLFTQENCLLVFNGAIMDEAGWPVRRRGDKPENVDLGQARLPFMVGQEDTIEPVVKEVSSVYEQRYVHFILETSENLSRILFQYRVYKRGSR